MKTRNPIRKRLRILRAEHDLTQQVVATKAGMSIVRYNEIEQGLRPPTDADLSALARVLKCQPSDIVPTPEQVSR